jgi:hypothetical protein
MPRTFDIAGTPALIEMPKATPIQWLAAPPSRYEVQAP